MNTHPVDPLDREQAIATVNRLANDMRRTILGMSLEAGASSSHFGGGLSLVEIAASLFGVVMRLDPQNAAWSERDRFILSKGHGCLGYYAALAHRGFIPMAELASFERNDSYLAGHPIMTRDRGIEFSNGSLGMGLSLGIGVALAGRRRQADYSVYVVMGDGECNEGSVWEAAMSAAHFRLGNLVAVVDRNGFQQTGANKDIMSVGDLAAKWAAFGWNTVEVDGHDVGQLLDAFAGRKPDCPLAVVAHTVKGKGFSFSEHNNDWHHKILGREQYEQAMAELESGRGNIQ